MRYHKMSWYLHDQNDNENSQAKNLTLRCGEYLKSGNSFSKLAFDLRACNFACFPTQRGKCRSKLPDTFSSCRDSSFRRSLKEIEEIFPLCTP